MLQISTQKARIGIQTTNAALSYTQPRGQWNMQTQKAQMQVTKGMPQVVIDQTIPFAEAGLKTQPMLMREYADLGRQYVLEGIARRAREGDLMARPPYGNAIPQIIQSRLPLERADFNVAFIPQSRPEIDFTGLEFEINWQIGGVETDFTPRKPEFNYTPGRVDIYMEQYPEIRYQYDITV